MQASHAVVVSNFLSKSHSFSIMENAAHEQFMKDMEEMLYAFGKKIVPAELTAEDELDIQKVMALMTGLLNRHFRD